MRLGGDHFDIHQLADQGPRSFGEHRLHVRRASDDLALAPAWLLKQNLEAPPNGLPVEGLPLVFDNLLKRREPPSLGRFVNLAGHLGSGRSRPGGIFKGVRRGEAHRPNESERLIEIGVGFAGITDDEVRGEGDIRARGAYARNNVEIVGDAMAAVHRLQHIVGAGLDRQMEIGRERWNVAMGLDEILAHVVGVRGRITHAADPGHSGGGADQRCEPDRLAASVEPVIGVDVLTEQRDLAHVGASKACDLLKNGGGGREASAPRV